MSIQGQLDLFSAVAHAYARTEDGALSNQEAYLRVARHAGISEEQAKERLPVGKAGVLRNTFERKVRWYQQTLKEAGFIERVPDARGMWRLSKAAGKTLRQVEPQVSVIGFSTELGIAILGSCDNVFASIDSPISLVLTSPPYPLMKARAYGNPPEHVYVDWVCKMLEPLVRNMMPGASLCLNVSNDIFMPGSPARSLYRERLVLALHDRLGLHKMDELIWENKSKPPGPFQYASKSRTQLNVVYEPVYWFTNDPLKVRSDNRRVLQAHTAKHLELIARGGEQRSGAFSDGAYSLKPGAYSNPTEGRIARNVLSIGHRCASQSSYKNEARKRGLTAHGAPMPLKLAKFLVEFLTQPDDLVVDPFGGSFTTALAAQELGRRWISSELMLDYVMGGAHRFEQCPGFANNLAHLENDYVALKLAA